MALECRLVCEKAVGKQANITKAYKGGKEARNVTNPSSWCHHFSYSNMGIVYNECHDHF
jgi:hypothetical protein